MTTSPEALREAAGRVEAWLEGKTTPMQELGMRGHVRTVLSAVQRTIALKRTDYDVQYWRDAYEALVKQTGRDLNDGLGRDPRAAEVYRALSPGGAADDA